MPEHYANKQRDVPRSCKLFHAADFEPLKNFVLVQPSRHNYVVVDIHK